MNSTTVTLLPVCNCGYVFKYGIYVADDIVKTNEGCTYLQRHFNPSICPNCKGVIKDLITWESNMNFKEFDVLIDFIVQEDCFDSICDKLQETNYCEKNCEKCNLEKRFDRCVKEYARLKAKENEQCKE